MSAFEADRFNHSRTSPNINCLVVTGSGFNLRKVKSPYFSYYISSVSTFCLGRLKLFGIRKNCLAASNAIDINLACAPLTKKLLEHFRRTARQDAGPNLHTMIQAGVIDHLQHRMDGACFRIFRSVHETRDTGMNCGSRAHRARLNCSKQFAVAKAVITEVSSGLAQGDNFGVRGGIGIGQVAVPASPDDAAGVDNDGSYGNLV